MALVPHVSKMMTCIKIRLSPKDSRYLISLSIDKYAYSNCYHSVYWNIKKIELEKKARDDPKKFDKMIDAIKASERCAMSTEFLPSFSFESNEHWKPRSTSILLSFIHVSIG